VDFDRLLRFCDAHPDDGICAPQKEFQFSRADAEAFFAEPAGASELAHANDDHGIQGMKAAFVMAPGIVQSLDPESLKRVRLPVAILLGDADKVAPPATNGEVAAALIPGARLTVLPHVGHYDFLAECTPSGDAVVPFCPTEVPRAATHKAAIDDALALFDATLAGK
jgi:pimeloyl-ACP methyl ester carboxylesterase